MFVIGAACVTISLFDGYPRLVALSILSVCSLVSIVRKCYDDEACCFN